MIRARAQTSKEVRNLVFRCYSADEQFKHAIIDENAVLRGVRS